MPRPHGHWPVTPASSTRGNTVRIGCIAARRPYEVGVEKALTTALAHLGAGRLGEAEALCQAILARRPKEIAALHCLGLVGLQGGNPDRAVAFLGRAASLTPADPAVLSNLGSARRAAGQLHEARSALKPAPENDSR